MIFLNKIHLKNFGLIIIQKVIWNTKFLFMLIAFAIIEKKKKKTEGKKYISLNNYRFVISLKQYVYMCVWNQHCNSLYLCYVNRKNIKRVMQ